MTFLREYWLWIATPFAIVLGTVLLFLWMTSGDIGASPFIYNVF